MVIIPVPEINLIANDPDSSAWTVVTSSVVHYTQNVSAQSGLYFPTSTPNGTQTMCVYFLNITLERNPSYYVFNIIAPLIIITGKLIKRQFTYLSSIIWSTLILHSEVYFHRFPSHFTKTPVKS